MPDNSPATIPRVLLLTDADVFAGTERHILALAAALRREQVHVRIGCPVPSPLAGRAAEENIEVIAIPKRGQIDWRAARQLRRLLKSGDIHLIHAHNGRTALAASIAVLGLPEARLVLTQHFLHPAHTRRRGAAALLSRVIHHRINTKTDHFIAISHAVAAAMQERDALPPNRITVVHNGLATINRALLTPPEQLRRDLGIPPTDPLIVCAARLEPEKNLTSLITAMQKVRAAFPTVHCLIAGQGSQHALLKSQISNLNLCDCVRLLGFREDALSLVNAADCFVLPSLAEPFGLVLLEAMALGKPVVATHVAGPIEIVEDGATGLLIAPSDPNALADALRRILGDASAAAAMGARGRERFAALFSDTRMAAATAGVYRQLL